MIHQGLIKQLRDCYEGRPEYAELFRFLAGRKRSTGQVVISKLISDPELRGVGSGSGRRRVVLELFRFLQQIGVGALIVGRRGKQTRFKWADDTTMLEVARAAVGDTSVEDETTPAVAKESVATLTIAHQFVIRPGTLLRLDLPVDFSLEEAERLATFIRALPFPTRHSE